MKRAQGKAASSRAFGAGGGGGGGGGFGGFSKASDAGSSLSYLVEPPSFTAISDPNAVVSFKNTLKKDSVTKGKGLEELLVHVQAHPYEQDGGVEEAILDAWVKIYPRTAIDNSRRVRELSHTLQYELMKSARKRMERHVPSIVGAWLAGLYDRDRIVSRAANDGLSSFLTTPEKVNGFWKKCQAQILEYATDTIKETQDTLSDERSTTKEDAEAKYYRVVTASLSLVLSLLQRMTDSDMVNFQSQYDDYFAEENVWKSITFNDSSVRKAVCQLLFVCLERKLPYAETTKAKQAFVTGGLRTSQAASAFEYARALTELSKADPSIWASANEKKSAFKRLQAFISKGSQGSPPKFWACLDQLLLSLPDSVLTYEASSTLLDSLKSGITNREEPRTNTSFAWQCYIDLAKRLLKNLPGEEQLNLAKQHLFPLIEQFLFSVNEKSSSIPLGPNAMSIFVQAYLAMVQADKQLVTAFAEEWKRLSEVFCSKISSSLPEVSKEFQVSQDKIGEEGRRWFALIGQIHSKLSETEEAVVDQTLGPSQSVLEHTISLLQNRNLKPYGAARIIEYALSTSPHLFEGAIWKRTIDFMQSASEPDMSSLVQSTSSRYLFSCLRILGAFPQKTDDYSRLWNSWTAGVLSLEADNTRQASLASLISHEKASQLCQSNEKLQSVLLAQVLDTIRSKTDAWELFESAVAYHCIREEAYPQLARDSVNILEREAEHSANALKAIEILVKGKPTLFSTDQELHAALVAQLLSHIEIGNEAVSSRSATIRSLLDSKSEMKSPVATIIQSNLERASAQSLEIETIVQQAKNAPDISREDLFPSTNVWMAELGPFLERTPDPSLSITNSLGGAIALISSEGSPSDALQVQRDRKGRSIPVRMALYLLRLLEDGVGVETLADDFRVELLFALCITMQLVSDQITTLAPNGLWKYLGRSEAVDEAEGLVTATRNLFNIKLVPSRKSDSDGSNKTIEALIQFMLRMSVEALPLPTTIYSARALSDLVQSVVETRGLSSELESSILTPDILKPKAETALRTAAIVVGLGETGQTLKQINNLTNRLVSDLAAVSIQDASTHATLVLLSLCGAAYSQGELPVANNRIVFAVRQITSWLEEPDDISAALNADICRALTHLLPCMKDLYGPYWEKTLDFCVELFDKAEVFPLTDALPFIHASLKLTRTLASLPEPSDDLSDALKSFSLQKAEKFIDLLKLQREMSTQPLEIVDAMLCREIDKLPPRQIPEIGDIFPLLTSESRDIQSAAFGLLHRAIPDRQEQNSVDVLLNKTDAQLPDELLSLFLDAPTLEKYSDEMLAEFPTSIRCYLLAWKLVFDAYSTSSFKIKTDFTEHLKSEECVSPLLEFMFDVLGHSAARPLKLERVGLAAGEHVKDYDVKLAEEAETKEKSMQWLLVHLYYLTLKYIPGLFRAWYIACRSKQTRIAVESWTTKYFSPLIVDDTLDEVQKWAAEQEPPGADENELTVKVSRPAREVTAGYEVDEEQATIVIKIPSSYPIDSIAVVGANRVAVNERKWQSWIMTTQGVITFSNGNIIDGLQVFKRNIVGALRGQGECAICYSIISADKRMPDKRCTTCKNLFHRTCLYKWFQSSSQNTCPLCRNPIDYIGADTAKRRR